jgi:hypothetical protein
MAAKILISGLANAGKTSLLKSLEEVLVVAHDGKKYPFPQPHVNVDKFGSADELIALTNEKVGAYMKAYNDKLPKTIVYDSGSKIFETLSDACAEKYNGFAIFQNLNREIHKFTEYIENVLIAKGINVIIVSHAMWDADTATYQLVGQGSFSKKGGFLSEVDYASFIETKANKRIVHNRSTKYPARTLIEDIPDSEDANAFNLQEYVNKIVEKKNAVADFSL